MKELLDLVDRFQALGHLTGADKISSYNVNIILRPWDGKVFIELGGYNVGNWARNEVVSTNRTNLLKDLEAKVVEAENIVWNSWRQ